jgi:uncharacterized protein
MSLTGTLPPQARPSGLAETVLADTRRWLEQAVIGLNLCPFAKGVYVKNQIHFTVSAATDAQELLADLKKELSDLNALDPADRDTTLLIAPTCLAEFLDFNAFVDSADRLLGKMKLHGTLQLASFHPAFEFADAAPGDITHFTNRSPYPMLHVLREASVAQAVAVFPQAGTIYGKNKQTLTDLGLAGWAALDVGSHARSPS